MRKVRGLCYLCLLRTVTHGSRPDFSIGEHPRAGHDFGSSVGAAFDRLTLRMRPNIDGEDSDAGRRHHVKGPELMADYFHS